MVLKISIYLYKNNTYIKIMSSVQQINEISLLKNSFLNLKIFHI